MPCYSPTAEDMAHSRGAAEASRNAKDEIDRILLSARDVKLELDRVTAILCAECKEREPLTANGKAWWLAHQEWDRLRRA